MSFETRADDADRAKNLYLRYCQSKGIHYAHTGYEHWSSSSSFMKILKDAALCGGKNIEKSHLWTRIRYLPDLFTISNSLHGCFIDIKGGKNGGFIEKDAYEFYMALLLAGVNVAIAIVKYDKIFSCFIDQIKLKQINSETYLDAPVIDNVWITPRMLENDKYDEWKENHKGSGTAFGIIDYDATKFHTVSQWDDGKPLNRDIGNSRYLEVDPIIVQKFIEYCDKTSRQYGFAGASALMRSDAFLPSVKKSREFSCYSIRNFPDMMVVKPDKTTGSLIKFISNDLKINRSVFNLYAELYANIGLNISFITVIDDVLVGCPIQSLAIKDMEQKDIPVVDNKWADPKKLKRGEYAEYIERNKSDESFGFIDEKCFQKL